MSGAGRRLGMGLCLLMLGLMPACAAQDEKGNAMDLEEAVCGPKEPILFWLWSNAAGQPDAGRLGALEGVASTEVKTVDGRVLRGYRLKARTPARQAKGYLLVLQGNAILADQILGEFTRFARAGYDVYVYDYRGYGRSQGKRRLKAMVSDTGRIIAQLNGQSYERRLVYAFSFGGILLLNAYEDALALYRVVIDSTPGRLSDYGCPVQYDPVTHLPADCDHFLLITGGKDKVVTPQMSRELTTQAARCGARTVDDADMAHPFMDPDPAARQRRMQLVSDFLLAGD